MSARNLFCSILLAVPVLIPTLAGAASEPADTAGRPEHVNSVEPEAGRHDELPDTPPLPPGMTLDDVLERASIPPPAEYPDAIPDDMLQFFILGEQLEYRVQPDATDQLGWLGQAWVGYDYNRLWIKTEGESVFEGTYSGESQWDILYSRLLTPFWNVQAGIQYANEWESETYDDRWSGVVSILGLTPGLVESDVSLYFSDEGDFTAVFEGEYNIRLTQRLVLQPRVELGFAAQDVSDRGLGAGMTNGFFDLRLRYEFRREFAPYIGTRYGLLIGETADLARGAGEDSDDVFVNFGVRFAY